MIVHQINAKTRLTAYPFASPFRAPPSPLRLAVAPSGLGVPPIRLAISNTPLVFFLSSLSVAPTSLCVLPIHLSVEDFHLVFALSIDILKHDNEYNAVSIHIILNYCKTFRADLATQVQPFLDIGRALYESLGNTI